MLLYIIRHGDPDYSTDTLTPKGVLQAEAVAKRLQQAGINKIFSSPMGRAKQTAEPLCRLLNMEYAIEEWTHEIQDERLTTYPTGVPTSVNLVQNTHYFSDGSFDVPYSQAMSTPIIRNSHMDKACKYIWENGVVFLQRLGYKAENNVYRIQRPNDDKVALFCHAAFARAWIAMLLHIPLHVMCASTEYCHTGVTVLEFKNNPDGYTAPRCLCYSDMSHYYKEGLELRYNNDPELIL